MSFNLLMLSGDRDVAAGRQGPFHSTLEGLAAEFARIDVLTPRVDGGQERLLHERVHVHPSPVSRLFQRGWLIKHARALRIERAYQLIVSHDYGIFSNGLAAAALSRRWSVPYVSEIHHIPAHPKRAQWWEPAAQLGYRLYARWAASRARAIRVVNHREVPDLLVRWGVPRERILVLPSAYIDRQTFAPGDEPKQYALGFVGRLVANKGLSYLAEIIAAVASDQPRARFIVVGKGPAQARLQRDLRARGLLERVTLTPWVDGPDALAAIYRQLDALVCTSRSEGGPRVCLEAMACGVPVFSTPVGVMPETIESGVNGWLLPWETDRGAALVVQALRDRTALAAAAGVARLATEPFERARVLGAYATAYRMLAEEAAT